MTEDKPLKNEVTLDSLRIGDGGILYFKDLGEFTRAWKSIV